MSQLRWKFSPTKKLLIGSSRISGRNNRGRITSYHRGGGCKKLIRLIDYNRYIWNVFGFVHRLEYDPKRNALIALIVYSNGIMSYIVAPDKLFVGDCIITKDSIVYNPGNAAYVKNIPIGVRINSIELYPSTGAQLTRAAGAYATIVAKSESFVVLRLKSTELRRVSSNCMATIGTVSNFQYIYRNFRKAGFYRLLGWRPVVRGVAMNPIDHPHGGGQGKTSGGRPSVTPWGVITKGQPTRSNKSNFYIIKSRQK